MINRKALRRTLIGAGLLFDGRLPESRRFLGSCFSVLDPKVFVTGGHCLEDVSSGDIWVNHSAGPAPSLFTRVSEIEFVRGTDIAVFRTEAPQAQWAAPFSKLRYWADYGEEVGAVGHPEDLISQAASREVARFFRGIVQRPFLFEHAKHRYSAFELSFPCPPGLSGGPLFLADNPGTVIGVVTGNFESYAVRRKDVRETQPGHVEHFEEHQIITFGVAANIFYACETIERALGHRLPDPDPEV